MTHDHGGLSLREIFPGDGEYQETVKLFGPGSSRDNAITWVKQNITGNRLVGNVRGELRFRSWKQVPGNITAEQVIEVIAQAYHEPSLKLVQWSADFLATEPKRLFNLGEGTGNLILFVNGSLLVINRREQALAFIVDTPMVVAWAQDSPFWILARLTTLNVVNLLPDALLFLEMPWPKTKPRFASVFFMGDEKPLQVTTGQSEKRAMPFIPFVLNQLGRNNFVPTDEGGVAQIQCQRGQMVVITKN